MPRLHPRARPPQSPLPLGFAPTLTPAEERELFARLREIRPLVQTGVDDGPDGAGLDDGFDALDPPGRLGAPPLLGGRRGGADGGPGGGGAEAASREAEAIADALTDRIARSNLAMVVTIARPYVGRCGDLDFDRLVSAGSLGLARAIAAFDPARNFKFSTLATHAIRNQIRRDIALDRPIHVPVHVQSAIIKGVRPGDSELVRDGLAAMAVLHADAIDHDSDADGPDHAFAGLEYRDGDRDDPGKDEDDESGPEFAAVLARLRPAYRDVLNGRFAGLSFVAIGREMGFTKQRARQVYGSAIRAARKAAGTDEATAEGATTRLARAEAEAARAAVEAGKVHRRARRAARRKVLAGAGG